MNTSKNKHFPVVSRNAVKVDAAGSLDATKNSSGQIIPFAIYCKEAANVTLKIVENESDVTIALTPGYHPLAVEHITSTDVSVIALFASKQAVTTSGWGVPGQGGGEEPEEPAEVVTGYSEAEIQTLLTAGYIPVASADDLHAMESAQTDRTWAAGTDYEVVLSTTGANENYLQVADIDLDHATLSAAYGGDWYDGTNGWKALFLYSSNDLTGIYDGANHTISNLYSRQTGNFLAAFISGVNSGGVVKNLRMTDVDVAGALYTGGCISVLRGNGTTIRNVRVTGSVSGSSFVGGLISYYNVSSGQKAYGWNSSFTGTVVGTGTHVGGLVGSNVRGSLRNCFAKGSVTGDQYVGGLTGRSQYCVDASGTGGIYNCFAACNITGNTDTGGLIGAATSTNLFRSYYDATVSGQSDIGKGAGLTTAQLQTPIRHSTTVSGTDVFLSWSGYIWNFGGISEYPTFQDNRITFQSASIFSEFSKYAGNPIIDPSGHEAYPQGVYYDGTYYYLFNENNDNGIYYWRSDDGFTGWNAHDAGIAIEALLDTSLSYAGKTVGNMEYTTIREIGGTYYMFFGVNCNDGTTGIGYATASSLEGPWTPSSNWVFNPDSNDTLAQLGIEFSKFTAPELVRVDDTYYWFVQAEKDGRFFQIYATSPVSDIFNITTQGFIFNGTDFAEILDEPGDYESYVIQGVRVHKEGSTFYFTLTAGNYASVLNQRQIYVVKSSVLTAISTLKENLQVTPIITTDGVNSWSELRTYNHDLLKLYDGYWLTLDTSSGKRRIYYSGHSLPTSTYTPQNSGIPAIAELTV